MSAIDKYKNKPYLRPFSIYGKNALCVISGKDDICFLMLESDVNKVSDELIKTYCINPCFKVTRTWNEVFNCFKIHPKSFEKGCKDYKIIRKSKRSKFYRNSMKTLSETNEFDCRFCLCKDTLSIIKNKLSKGTKV